MHRVAVDTLEALAKTVSGEETVVIGKVGGKAIEMKVKKYLTMREFNKFVMDMAFSQFSINEYVPQHDSIVFDVVLCEYYSNVNLPETIEASYEMVQKLDLKKKILDVVGETEQYKELRRCIDEIHSFVKEQRAGFGGLIEMVKNAITNFDINEILDMLKGFSPDQLENLAEMRELANIFSAPQKPVKDNILPFSVVGGAEADAAPAEVAMAVDTTGSDE